MFFSFSVCLDKLCVGRVQAQSFHLFREMSRRQDKVTRADLLTHLHSGATLTQRLEQKGQSDFLFLLIVDLQGGHRLEGGYRLPFMRTKGQNRTTLADDEREKRRSCMVKSKSSQNTASLSSIWPRLLGTPINFVKSC